MKKVIWDLFGGGQNSVYNTLKEFNLLDEYDIYTFDIVTPQHSKQRVLNLSSDIRRVLSDLSPFPKPDIILASPLCQSFSMILAMKNGGNCCWEPTADGLKIRSKESFEKNKNAFTRNMIYERQLEKAILGKKCIDNTIKIIEIFKPKYYYIENPRKSLMWKYIEQEHKEFWTNSFTNITNYNNYGFISKKPTIFLSNVLMNLNTENKSNYVYYTKDGIKYIDVVVNGKVVYNDKANFGRSRIISHLNNCNCKTEHTEAEGASAIPHLLIKEILESFKNWQWSK